MKFYAFIYIIYISILSTHCEASLSEIKDETAQALQGHKFEASLSETETVQALQGHKKARLNRFKPYDYPTRFKVKKNLAAWNEPFPDYDPPFFTHLHVINNDRTVKLGGWADPEDIRKLKDLGIGFRVLKSLTGDLKFDDAGLPLNPYGRTGLSGRGLLGKWAANLAADPIIIRLNPDTRTYEMLAVQRKDTKEWAIPGGMVEDGDTITKTLAKELLEETGIKVTMQNATIIYKGYVDDPRNTDNAWMETIAKCLFVSHNITTKMELDCSKDQDTLHTQWMPLEPSFINNLYASHKDFVLKALKKIGKGKIKEITDKTLL